MTTKKDDIMGLIAARKEDEGCLTFTYGSESRLGGAGGHGRDHAGRFHHESG